MAHVTLVPTNGGTGLRSTVVSSLAVLSPVDGAKVTGDNAATTRYHRRVIRFSCRSIHVMKHSAALSAPNQTGRRVSGVLRGHLGGVLVLVVALLGARGVLAQSAGAPAAQTGAPLRVGLYLSAPFVTKAGDTYSGYAVDLWQTIAGRAGLTYEYTLLDTIPSILAGVQDRSLDVAVLDLTITADRLQRMDFTTPWMSTGLRLMINEDRRGGFWHVLETLRASGHLKIYGLLILFVIVGTAVLTVFDRRYDDDFPQKWTQGLAESLYHMMSLVTSGTSSHKPVFGAVGRALAAIWLACGVAVIAYITSSVTSVMTATSLTAQISSTADLARKRVGATVGSVGAQYAREAGWNVMTFLSLEQSVQALVRGEIDAVVDDAPTLEAFDNEHPKLPITEVGPVFRPQQYAFAVPSGSALGHTLSLQILAAAEAGVLEKLKSKYFANTP